jgi:hypothetical protein
MCSKKYIWIYPLPLIFLFDAFYSSCIDLSFIYTTDHSNGLGWGFTSNGAAEMIFLLFVLIESRLCVLCV